MTSARKAQFCFSIVEIQGRSDAQEVSHRYQVTFEKGREYWMNAVVAATVARLIAEGRGVINGVHFLTDAVDPVTFMEELRKLGVSQTESLSEGREQKATNASA